LRLSPSRLSARRSSCSVVCSPISNLQRGHSISHPVQPLVFTCHGLLHGSLFTKNTCHID
jgi:hypothetical protein